MNSSIRTLIPLIGLAALSVAGNAFAQATDVDCVKCVDSRDIALQAVTNGKLADNSISTVKLKRDAVVRDRIQDDAINSRKIADGSIGASDVNSRQVQLRVDGTCPVGSFVAGVSKNGNVSCEHGGDDKFSTRYGDTALNDTSTGVANTAVGYLAVSMNSSGKWNTGIGVDALGENTIGNYNTATGVNALWHNESGNNNTGTGIGALQSNISGSSNTATGSGALAGNSTGDNNTATGESALHDNDTGSANTAFGFNALGTNTDGEANTAVGYAALWDHASGSSNVAIGQFAGSGNTSGSFNIAIGTPGVNGESNTMRLGATAEQHRTFIAGVRGVSTGVADAVTVVIDSSGQLGTVSSSQRYKEDVRDMGASSDALMALRPVTFRYREAYADGGKPIEYGLIAEEVAETFPDLVVYDENERPATVKYRLLSSLLLNEVQKQNAALDGQTAEIAELKSQIEALSRRLDQATPEGLR